MSKTLSLDKKAVESCTGQVKSKTRELEMSKVEIASDTTCNSSGLNTYKKVSNQLRDEAKSYMQLMRKNMDMVQQVANKIVNADHKAKRNFR